MFKSQKHNDSATVRLYAHASDPDLSLGAVIALGGLVWLFFVIFLEYRGLAVSDLTAVKKNRRCSKASFLLLRSAIGDNSQMRLPERRCASGANVEESEVDES
jgi:hypothetical protein